MTALQLYRLGDPRRMKITCLWKTSLIVRRTVSSHSEDRTGEPGTGEPGIGELGIGEPGTGSQALGSASIATS